MHALADMLIRLLAPILPPTADEAYRALFAHGEPGAADDARCVHLETNVDPPPAAGRAHGPLARATPAPANSSPSCAASYRRLMSR